MIKALYTIGTSGRHDDDFLAVLQQHQIDAVIDIRLWNEGRYYKAEHCRRRLLAEALADVCRMSVEHLCGALQARFMRIMARRTRCDGRLL
ncbi:MAG: hypothetical protein GX571_08410 [Lentisphaerae bacterium]|nr:hypothetical protein [Lentisphaerota bacterium]